LAAGAGAGQELGRSLEVGWGVHLFHYAGHPALRVLFLIFFLLLNPGQTALFVLFLLLLAVQKVLSHNARNFFKVFEHLLARVHIEIGRAADC
jgi:hypothetical protein